MNSSRGADTGRVLGRVVGLWRYPVKSMGAEELRAVHVSWHGLAGDRRWAFLRDAATRSGAPFLTVSRRPIMVRYRPRIVEPARPEASSTVVRSPAGEEYDVADPALAGELGGGVRAVRLDRGVFDALPLSVITTQSVVEIGALAGGGLDVLRFRPNLLVEPVGRGSFAEDAWVGQELRIGEALVRIDARDGRCAVVNVDPETSERDPAVLRSVVRERQGCLGVYGSTVQPGRVAVGDSVRITGARRRRGRRGP